MYRAHLPDVDGCRLVLVPDGVPPQQALLRPDRQRSTLTSEYGSTFLTRFVTLTHHNLLFSLADSLLYFNIIIQLSQNRAVEHI